MLRAAVTLHVNPYRDDRWPLAHLHQPKFGCVDM